MHTKGKWTVEILEEPEIFLGDTNKFIARVCIDARIPEEERKANAKRIVQMNNSFDDLLEACKESKELLRQYPAYVGINKEICEHLEQAIAKAEEIS